MLFFFDRSIMEVIVLLLIAVPFVMSYDECTSSLSDRCIQKCNATTCECDGRTGQRIYQGCTQMCGHYPCKKIVCSSGNCIQSCHGCSMECTGDVGFCVQRCLSGKCEFKCAATHCDQDCHVGNCKLTRTTTTTTTSVIPKPYLMLLAGCFAATTILSLIALCLSCRGIRQQRKNRYQRLRPITATPPSQVHATRHGHFDSEGMVCPIRVLPLVEKPV